MHQLVEIADTRDRHLVRQFRSPLRRPIVVKAGQPQAHLGRCFNVPGELNAQLVHAADRIAPRIEAAGPQPLLNLSQHDAGRSHRGRRA